MRREAEMEVIRVENVSYCYKTKYQEIDALKNVSCSFETGKMYAITGKSGSGKSTLLSLLAGLDTPAAGEIFIEGQSLKNIDRDEYRRKQASVVYQAFHLFPLLNAVENVMFPMELNGVKQTEAKLQAEELIKKVGLEAKIFRQFPKMMSGGEQQRIAIARAMASKGTILLADEPTGNLDSKNEELITALLKKLAYEEQYTVIVVTHNAAVSKKADIVYVMQDGELKGE